MSKSISIAILPGDGIGPEIMEQAEKVLWAISEIKKITLNLQHAPFGAESWFNNGSSFPKQTIAICDAADAILKGPIGLSAEESKKIPQDEQPERAALLPLRNRYQTYANFRPVYLPSAFANFSPLKGEIIREGIDIMIIRELVGGLYFGKKEAGVNKDGERYAIETLEYTETQITRVVKIAFETALKRRKMLHSIHKNNVLKSSVLWTNIVDEVSQNYPTVKVNHMLVDAAATAMCLCPNQFDVMVMENLFGDILSDQAGGLLGSLGLMPSACIGVNKAYYEPSHGSAPQIAGKGIANPYSMIGSVAMMLEMSFNMNDEAISVWNALKNVFADGFATADLSETAGLKTLTTNEFGDKVVDALFKSMLKK